METDHDLDGTIDPTTVSIVSNSANGTLVNNGDGTVTYTPDPDYNGPDSFTYTVQDDGGTTSNVATVDIGDGGVTNRYDSGLDINSESTNGASVFSAANFYTEDDTIDVLFNAAAANAKIWIAALCVDFSQKHPKAS